MVVVAGGALVVRHQPGEASTAVRVASTGTAPETIGPETQPAAAVSAISLGELARQARAGAATATTTTARPRGTTTTTAKPRGTTTTTPATAPPATSTTVAPPRAAAAPTSSTVAPLTPLTTLLQEVVPPAEAVSGAVTRSDSGVASWFKATSGTCAHRTLPMGTVVKVTRASNGASASCTVADRGPAVATGRLIDLSLDTFEKLADRDAGLIEVTIHW